jgi:cysteine desulfurase
MDFNTKVYLDHAATTPVDQHVVEVMLPYFRTSFGNPSSLHWYGQQAEMALENSREMVASNLNCSPQEVIFTSCGTESDNLAIRGAAHAARASNNKNHILISPVEHHAVSITAHQMAELHGFHVEYLPVDEYGLVSPEEVAHRMRDDTALVSVIYANNEIGSINPLTEIGEICRQNGVIFHTDAVQAAAYLPLDVQSLNVDLLSIGAHKFYGPKGVGALFIRQGTPLIPAITGGSQEFKLRAGTHNIPYIVGLAHALQLRQKDRDLQSRKLISMRDYLIKQVLEKIPEARLSGHATMRLPNHASFVFKGVDGNALLMMLDEAGFACSSGSACKTGNPEPSEVLLALSLPPQWALGSLRVSLGIHTTWEEIEAFVNVLPGIIANNRSLAESFPQNQTTIELN